MAKSVISKGKYGEITIFNGKIHYKWSFSIAMLNYQRVKMFKPLDFGGILFFGKARYTPQALKRLKKWMKVECGCIATYWMEDMQLRQRFIKFTELRFKHAHRKAPIACHRRLDLPARTHAFDLLFESMSVPVWEGKCRTFGTTNPLKFLSPWARKT